MQSWLQKHLLSLPRQRWMMQMNPPETGRRAKSQQPAQSSISRHLWRSLLTATSLQRGGDPHSAGLKVFLAPCRTKQGKSDKYRRICRVSPRTKALAEAIASALLRRAQLAGRGGFACGHGHGCAHTWGGNTVLRAFPPALQGLAEGHWNSRTAAGCRSSPALILAAERAIPA